VAEGDSNPRRETLLLNIVSVIAANENDILNHFAH